MKKTTLFLLSLSVITMAISSGYAAYTANTGSPDNIDNDLDIDQTLSVDGSLITLDADATTGGVTLQLDEVTIGSARPQLSFIGNATNPGLFVWGYDDGAGGLTIQMELDETSQLMIAGNLDVDGDTLGLGSLPAPYEYVPVVSFSAVDGGLSVFTNKATRYIHTWTWTRGSSVGDKKSMSLYSHPNGTELSLFESTDAGSNAALITLDADATDPKITINGEEVLTESSAGALYDETGVAAVSVNEYGTIWTSAPGNNTLTTNAVNSAIFGTNQSAHGSASITAGVFNEVHGSQSASFGQRNKSNGAWSFSAGRYANALGNRSVALVGHNNAIGNDSIAMGFEAYARAEGSIAIGRGVHAQGFQQTAMGRYNVLSGDWTQWDNTDLAFIVGNGADGQNRSNAFTVNWNGDTHVSGTLSSLKLAGINSVTTGSYAVALGNGTEATNYNTTSFGHVTRASGRAATSMGLYTIAQGHTQLAVGRSNLIEGDPENENFTTNPAFVVGNGTGGGLATTDRSNAFSVSFSGEVKALGPVKVPPSGDISMGSFTSGSDPREDLDPNHLHWTP